MASSPPSSPHPLPQRPLSAMIRSSPRSNSRMSARGGSRASDEDGKTSVKVAIRVRPPLRPQDPGYELIPQRFQKSMVHVTSPTSLAIDQPQGRKLFVFDRVFGEDVNQEGIWEYVSESVRAFTQGYNVSVLAYGQSGAGKSYTMGTSGPLEQAETDQMGVIPRAATALFEALEGPKVPRGSVSGLRTPTARYSAIQPPTPVSRPAERSWSLKATYVEIYNEQLRDLLVPEPTPMGERSQVTIREDTKGQILLTGLHQIEIHSVEDLLNALNFGSTIRQTDSTAINAKSSRSHAVFSLNLVQRKHKVQQAAPGDKRMSVPVEVITGGGELVTVTSKLHFVDLAGSERLKNTGAEGARAREGISINAGLASLGKVISQLSSRQAGSHVSYRDSKLTRLLQDSLGGNAITYMIACVTVPEFHLSETLNTVQYAQRARAIQSKPRIQQVSDESDKQTVIDRLKAEVEFLREQIRSSERNGGERSDRRSALTPERPERQNDREIELQNQLLDTQENYTALSQRHAKLIAEMSKARDEELAENRLHENSLGETASERLQRSNNFAEAVEQVILEYETTIQSLEQSLSGTRSSLSNSEAMLLEKETTCTRVEAINSQLQARIQKLMDREAATEAYLRDLEAKLDGHNSGEEKNSAIVLELRKEIARVRENEASCEDYISTLEERLAEADQDAELMQREIQRLEHVVERQRSLGKLDNLLYELDHIQQDGSEDFSPKSNGKRDASKSRKESSPTRGSHKNAQNGVPHVQTNSPRAASPETPRSAEEGPVDNGEPIDETATGKADEAHPSTEPRQSPAQSKAVEDKLETVTQELVDLRVEHESTVTDYELLAAKYEQALRTLAELQDAVDESRHPSKRDSFMSVSPNPTRPMSFLADARVTELKDGGHHSSSRSLSSELSSAGEYTSNMESETETATKSASSDTTVGEQPNDDEALAAEVEKLRQLAAERDMAALELNEKYAELQERHMETLDVVEELKAEVHKAKANGLSTSRSGTPVIRRKSGQGVMMVDRAHRSFASLRNIAADNLEDKPDIMQAFEVNLNACMHELHARSERVQELEADIAAVKKEMEAKMTIISGLTRERSSMKNSSPGDMSMLSTMRDQLMQSENLIRQLQESHTARERELVAEVAALKASLRAHAESSTTTAAEKSSITADVRDIQDKKIADLESELSQWEGRHHSALESMQASEKRLLATISELEARVATGPSAATFKGQDGEGVDPAVYEQIRAEHQNVVETLQKDIEAHKSSVSANAARIAELEQSHASAMEQLSEATKSREAALSEMDEHKSLVAKLEQQISDHERVVKSHEDGLNLLRMNHEREMEEVKAAVASKHDEHIAALTGQHEEALRTLNDELAEARDELTKVATQVAFALGVDVSIEKLEDRISDLLAERKQLASEQERNAELADTNKTLLKELDIVKTELSELLATAGDGAKLKAEHANVAEQLAVLKAEMNDLNTRNKKNSRLVEELEDQLASNFDQHQAANNRLSTLQSERNQQLEEAHAARDSLQRELSIVKDEYANLQAKFDEFAQLDVPKRTNSAANNVRKSSSSASLPSPPPVIPLPPLPGNRASGSVSPPPNVPIPATHNLSGTRPASKDVTMNQIHEDQEHRIRTIEKHLSAEKQLTATLEEALTDLERQSNKVKADCSAWQRKAADLEAEIRVLKEKPKQEERWSLHAVEEERKKRLDAEGARRQLEERMNQINKKKKKGSLNCF